MTGKIKETKVNVIKGKLTSYKCDLLILGLLKDTKKLPAEYTELNKALNNTLSNVIRLNDFTGKVNQTSLLYTPESNTVKRVLLLGLGEREKLNSDVVRKAVATATRLVDKLGISKCAISLHNVIGKNLSSEAIGQAIAEGAIFGRYDYQDHKSPEQNSNKYAAKMNIAIPELSESRIGKLRKGVKVGSVLAEGQNRARMIANKPGNEINPPALAKTAQQWAKKFGIKCTVFNKQQLTKMKMNGILAVGQGSVHEPRLIKLEYKGNKKRQSPDAVIVGKAITFDSGGISLKPSQNMEAMKFDKCGGCAVLGLMTALAQLKLPLNVTGLIPSAENKPSHTSYRPGDIVTTYSGKTVEVQNTDAEGRMILSDALSYAAKSKPGAIIDMATLTGACVVALGTHHAGLFSNNDKLKDQLKEAGEISGEKLWHLPSGDEYLEQMRSKIADLKNIGGREGGSCTGAAFLGEFVEKIPWAHIDVAGTSDFSDEKPFRAVGATGFGVRLILEYLRTLS